MAWRARTRTSSTRCSASPSWTTASDPAHTAGTTALALTGGLAFLVGFYTLFTARRIDPRPEDSKDGEIADGAGELGFFSPHSWWPLPLALSTAVIGLGLVFGWWLVAVGVGLLALALVGFVFEYYRGAHAH